MSCLNSIGTATGSLFTCFLPYPLFWCLANGIAPRDHDRHCMMLRMGQGTRNIRHLPSRSSQCQKVLVIKSCCLACQVLNIYRISRVEMLCSYLQSWLGRSHRRGDLEKRFTEKAFLGRGWITGPATQMWTSTTLSRGNELRILILLNQFSLGTTDSLKRQAKESGFYLLANEKSLTQLRESDVVKTVYGEDEFGVVLRRMNLGDWENMETRSKGTLWQFIRDI